MGDSDGPSLAIRGNKSQEEKWWGRSEDPVDPPQIAGSITERNNRFVIAVALLVSPAHPCLPNPVVITGLKVGQLGSGIGENRNMGMEQNPLQSHDLMFFQPNVPLRHESTFICANCICPACGNKP